MDVTLSDNSRRLICRTSFMLLCLAPTLICLKSILFPLTPSGWSSRFQNRFGVINRIGQVTTVSPQCTRFQNLKIGVDRFSSRMIIQSATLQSSRDGNVLRCTGTDSSASAFWNILQRMVDIHAWSEESDTPMLIQFDSITFHQDETPESARCLWSDVEFRIEDHGRFAQVSFTTDRHTESWNESAKLVAKFVRKIDDQGTSWSVDATGYRIPCWVIQDVIPIIRTLNHETDIADAGAALREYNGQWSGQLQGRLLDVDLHELVARRFGSQLTGRAQVHLNSMEIQDNRIHSLAGEFYCASGSVGPDLLNACTRKMGMQLVEPFGRGREDFTRMRFDFEIGNGRIAIISPDAGPVLYDPQNHQMLIASNGRRLPVSSLIQLFSTPMQPVNPGAAVLAKYLTIPAYIADPGAERTAELQEIGDGNFFDRWPSVNR